MSHESTAVKQAQEDVMSSPTARIVLGLNATLSARSRQDWAANGPVILFRAGKKVAFRSLPAGTRRVLELLVQGDLDEDELLAAAGGTAAAAGFLQFVARMGLVHRTSLVGGEAQLRVVPTSDRGVEPVAPAPGTRYVLSRFAHLRREGGELIAETPLAPFRAHVLAAPAGSLLASLGRPRRADELAEELPARLRPAIDGLLGLLLSAGLVDACPAGAPQPEEPAALRQWEFHDLLFHVRSRLGRHDYPLGQSFRFRGELPPQPGRRAAFAGSPIVLARPDLAEAARHDPPLTAVLEGRRSLREYGPEPVTLAQLGEFLYRSAGVRKEVQADGERYWYDTSQRPSPGGGGCYELEIYPIVQECAGLAAGIYHYDAFEHRLEVLPDRAQLREQIFACAELCNGARRRPPLLLAITARFQRVAWKYEGMAYATILKNVGALYQTMYLVGTAMRLAPCAMGMGFTSTLWDAEANAGEPFWVESPVGEFMLGPRAA